MDEDTQALLESEDPGDRVQGLRLVALLEDHDAVPLATRLLQDPVPDVREHAARGLGLCLGGRALALLEECARHDRDALVRRTALAVLGEVGESPAAAVLGRLAPHLSLADAPTALEALRACGDAAQAPVALAFAASDDPALRAVALHAHAALRPDHRSPEGEPLRAVADAVLERGPFWAIPAASIVRGDSAGPHVRRAVAAARTFEREHAVLRALELPASVGLEVLRELVRAPERGPEDRGAAQLAARELARRGDGSGAPLLARALYDRDGRGQLDAALGLAELGAPLGEPWFRRALEHALPGERAHVARGLALCGQPEGVRALGGLLASDVPGDRRLAARAFAELGRRDGAAELCRALDYPLRRERAEARESLERLWPEGPRLDLLAGAEGRGPVVTAFRGHFGLG